MDRKTIYLRVDSNQHVAKLSGSVHPFASRDSDKEHEMGGDGCWITKAIERKDHFDLQQYLGVTQGLAEGKFRWIKITRQRHPHGNYHGPQHMGPASTASPRVSPRVTVIPSSRGDKLAWKCSRRRKEEVSHKGNSMRLFRLYMTEYSPNEALNSCPLPYIHDNNIGATSERLTEGN